MFAFFWIRWGQTLSQYSKRLINWDCKCCTGELSELDKQTPVSEDLCVGFIFADKNTSNHFFCLRLYLFVVSSLILAHECTPGFERNMLSLQQSICGSSIVTGISHWPSPATHTLLGIWKGYWGTDEGFHPPDLPGEFFLCLPAFAASIQAIILQKTEPGLEILNPRRDLLHSLCVSWSPSGVAEAIHWNSVSYLCPLKSQYGVRKPLPAFSLHALLLSPRSPRMPQTSQDILKLDSHDVYLLINLCSKNDMSGNCKASAGRRQADDIRFYCTTGRQKWGRRKVHPGSSGVNWFLLRLAGCFLQLLQAKGSFYLEGIPTSVTKMHLLSCS